MKTEGVEAIFLTTHNWGRSAKFFQSLGYTLDFETDHNSGQLRNGRAPTSSSPKCPPTRRQPCSW